jgi:hypothetical protein
MAAWLSALRPSFRQRIQSRAINIEIRKTYCYIIIPFSHQIHFGEHFYVEPYLHRR